MTRLKMRHLVLAGMLLVPAAASAQPMTTEVAMLMPRFSDELPSGFNASTQKFINQVVAQETVRMISHTGKDAPRTLLLDCIPRVWQHSFIPAPYYKYIGSEQDMAVGPCDF